MQSVTTVRESSGWRRIFPLNFLFYAAIERSSSEIRSAVDRSRACEMSMSSGCNRFRPYPEDEGLRDKFWRFRGKETLKREKEDLQREKSGENVLLLENLANQFRNKESGWFACCFKEIGQDQIWNKEDLQRERRVVRTYCS